MDQASECSVAGGVVQSAAMRSPSRDRMTERRAYKTLRDAPPTHARLWRGEGDYSLTFNGADIVRMIPEPGAQVSPRVHSDGDFLSRPMTQQFLLSPDAPCRVRVEFAAPVEMWNVRPRRARAGEAILGQLGAPLMYGANGLYFPDWDLLLEWHGAAFMWEGSRISGNRAAMMVQLTQPWVILLRPWYYREHLGFAHHQPWDFRPNPKAVSGWCSWEAYHSAVTQADVTRSVRALEPLKKYGLEYAQLDDGYQIPEVPPKMGDAPDSWLTTNEKFPEGHAGIVRSMREGGFRPGIWLNASVNNAERALKIGCLPGPDGQPLFGDWVQYVYDCTPETLKHQVEPVYRAFKELGYEYVKSDAIRHLIYDGLEEAVRYGLLSIEDARARMRAYMACARAALGPDIYYLSCWGVLAESIGLCDAMRVATDANPHFYAYSMQLREMARWYGAQRILFTVDPDHVCVRGKLEWVRTALSVVSLMGGLFMLSDDPASYDAERLRLIQRALPALATHTGECGPADYMTPACAYLKTDEDLDTAAVAISHASRLGEYWCAHFDQNGRRWAVVTRAAIFPLEKTVLPLENLCLDPSKTYAALEMDSQKAYLTTGRLSLPALKLGCESVIALTDVSDGAPRVVGSDRHVSMDAVSIDGETWDGETLTLRLRGFPGLEAAYTLYAPTLTDGEDLGGGFRRVRVLFDREQVIFTVH